MSRVQAGQPVNCTTSKAAPVVDSVITGLEGLRTLVAISSDDSVYKNVPISREADIGIGVGLSALFVGSAIYGFSVTSRCENIIRNREPPRYPTPDEPPSSPEPSSHPVQHDHW
jgi:hypothetical protein